MGLKKNIKSPQLNLLYPGLEDMLNQKHELYLLENEIKWSYFEQEFESLYSEIGRPAHPIRLMVGLLILKALYNLSDEKLIEEHWPMNVYFQYFCGEHFMKITQPCAASDLTHFRIRIGEEGVEKIFKHSINLHGKDAEEKDVSVDSTAQEKNITFPTDAKLHSKIINKCNQIAKKERVTIRRSYTRTVKKLMRTQHNSSHPKRIKSARAARRKIKTIAGARVRELERILTAERLSVHQKDIDLFNSVLSQEKTTPNKIYSLHEPHVYCMSKGKAHKKYEFGCKGSVVITQNTQIIVGAMTFVTNVFDGHTLPDVLNQTERLVGKRPVNAVVDRGYPGKNEIETTIIIRPDKPTKYRSEYGKRKMRKYFRRRAAIEPTIGHLKTDHRVDLNFLKGIAGDSINFMMACAAYNYKKLMKKLKKACAFFLKAIQNEIFQLNLVWSRRIILFGNF